MQSRTARAAPAPPTTLVLRSFALRTPSLRTPSLRTLRLLAAPLLVCSLITLLVTAGCGDDSPGRRPKVAFTLTDDIGRNVRFDSIPRRIVSLAPSLTEMLFAVGAGNAVVGVTQSCNHPAAARVLPEVGDLLNPDAERVLSLQPDLVLISVEGNTQSSFEALERVGLRLFVSNPRTLEGVLESLIDLGRITGNADHAQHLADSLRGIAGALRSTASASPPGVLVLISTQPIMAAGSKTFINEIIELAGGRNSAAAAPGNYPTLNRETVLRMNPDLIIFPDDMHVQREGLMERFPEWRHVRAVQDGRLHAVDADVFLRPGPRAFLAARHLRTLISGTDSTTP